MKKVKLIVSCILFFAVAVSPAYSQIESKDNHTGDWSDPSTWVGTVPAILGLSEDVIVYGYVTVDELEMETGGVFNTIISNVQVYDTLVVKNDLQIGYLDDVYIAPEGVLVVLGDVQTRLFSGLINEGTVVIKGQLEDPWGGIFGGPYVLNDGEMYVYDPDPEFSPDGGANPEYSSSNQLQSDNQALYDFVESNGAEPLPVEVIYFKSTQQKEEVKLQWATSMEINFDYFEIARSTDTRTFTVIGKVPGAGNSDEMRAYQFVDNQPPSGDVFYRLVAVDLDGSREDHGIVHENVSLLSEENQIVFYPNPLQQSMLIVESPVIEGQGIFELYNQHGKLVLSETINKGENELYIPSDLVAGMYYVRIKHGGLSHNRPLIIQK